MLAQLRKIDCVLVKVTDLAAAASFYEAVFGLTRLWADATSVGMGMPDTDAEVVLHTGDVPVERSVNDGALVGSGLLGAGEVAVGALLVSPRLGT